MLFNYFKIGLSYKVCGKRRKPEGVFTVDSRYLRIKYVPKRSQLIHEIFTIIITSYGEGKFLYEGRSKNNASVAISRAKNANREKNHRVSIK